MDSFERKEEQFILFFSVLSVSGNTAIGGAFFKE
jgi:hypothetical protein